MIAIQNGDTIIVGYKANPDVAMVATPFVLATPASLTIIVDWFVDPTRPWFNSVPTQDGSFEFIKYVPKADANSEINAGRLDLTQCKICVSCKSDMRVQNRTTFDPSSPDSTLNLDTMPLVGYMYSGTGNGTDYFEIQGLGNENNYHGESSCGVINPNTTVTPITDPVSKNLYSGAKRQRPIRFEPGSIHTFKLKSMMTKDFNTLFNVVVHYQNLPNKTGKLPLGKFQFFSVEKEMDAGASGAYLFAVEVKYSCSAVCSFARKQVQLQEFQKNSTIIT